MSEASAGPQQNVPRCPTCGGGAPSRKRWDKERHKKIIEKAAELVQNGSPKNDAAAFSKWWNNNDFRNQLLEWLHRADEDAAYVDPVLFIPSYTKHFYDPDTKKNYWGETSHTAKTEAVDHFKASLKLRYENQRSPDYSAIGKELGLALHFLTDLSQPMHAANFTNLDEKDLFDWRHQQFETYAESQLEAFHDAPDVSLKENYLDWTLTEARSLEDLVHNLAVYSKQIYTNHVKPILDRNDLSWLEAENGKWRPSDTREADAILRLCLPHGERIAACFLLLWTRGYDSIVKRLYWRFLDRPNNNPDDNGQGRAHYIPHIINKNYTVRKIISEMGTSSEYFDKKVLPRNSEARRRLLYQDFLDREEKDASQRPTVREMDNIDHERWNKFINDMIASKEYSERFGDHMIPGYLGISERTSFLDGDPFPDNRRRP